jgi:thiosulfate/3-mercaptopyruvate sulfurtransferase
VTNPGDPSKPPSLVGGAWLEARLGDPRLVVVDLRWREDGSGRSRFDRGHVPGAVHLDWSTDIVEPPDPVAFNLARPEAFARSLEQVGIGDDTTVVAYSDRGGSGPFRLWWACRRYGHDQVLVLDGGFDRWVGDGRPVSAAPPTIRPASWRPAASIEEVATADDVLSAGGVPSWVVLDSRPPEQFRGDAVWFESGPVPADDAGVAHTPRGDLRAGRVPWARSVPWFELYEADWTLRPPEAMRGMFEAVGVRQESRCITYCGVGISASALLFALRLAGFEDAMLYDGSWDDWARSPERPVARG